MWSAGLLLVPAKAAGCAASTTRLNYRLGPGCYWLHRKVRKWTRRVAAKHPAKCQISEIQSPLYGFFHGAFLPFRPFRQPPLPAAVSAEPMKSPRRARFGSGNQLRCSQIKSFSNRRDR
jgi:hypothetical protein